MDNIFGDDDLYTSLVPKQEHMEETSKLGKFIQYISMLEGYKTKAKNLHWAAPAMNIHERLDEFLEIMSDYQDSIAEECQGIYGQFGPNDIKGISIEDTDGSMMLHSLLPKVENFYESLPSDKVNAGLRSETETFIHNINKYKYLFRLCKG